MVGTHHGVPVRVDAKPYSTVTLPDGGNYVFDLTAPSYAAPSGWKRTTGGNLPKLKAGEWVQIMLDGKDGWRNTVMKIGRDGKPLGTRHSDRSHRLDAPWHDNGKYHDGWYRVWPSTPPGQPSPEWNELDPKALLTVRTNGSTIKFKGRNAPAEGLQIYGDDNRLDVDLAGGPKIALEIDRPELRVWGDRNRVTGRITTEMVGVRLNGANNELRDLVVIGLEVGNDAGLVVFPGRGKNGNRAINVLAVCQVRRYPVTWVHTGFYLDDRSSNCVLVDCRAKGFQSGVFVHGGSNNTIELTSEDCEVPVIIVPHFTSPRDKPSNPKPVVRAIGQVAADRKVPALAIAG